jgi:ABC-type glycerol-3-phosphate transport system permease component
MDKKKRKASNYIIIVMLSIFALIALFPFYWNLISAFTPVSKIFTFPPLLIPVNFTLENFIRLPKYFPYFGRNILNSVGLAVLIPMISLFFNSLAGFAFAKYDFKGKNILFKILIATILIPTTSAYIPLFIEMSKLKLTDSYLAIILPAVTSAFGVFLFRQTIYSVPNEILESAKIDGAGDFTIYRRIVLPLIKPMLITIYITGFITTWNDYFWPFIILNTETKLTFPVILAGIQGQLFESPWGIIMVGALILMVPTIVIFSLLSKYIVPDIFSGGVKG